MGPYHLQSEMLASASAMPDLQSMSGNFATHSVSEDIISHLTM